MKPTQESNVWQVTVSATVSQIKASIKKIDPFATVRVQPSRPTRILFKLKTGKEICSIKGYSYTRMVQMNISLYQELGTEYTYLPLCASHRRCARVVEGLIGGTEEQDHQISYLQIKTTREVKENFVVQSSDFFSHLLNFDTFLIATGHLNEWKIAIVLLNLLFCRFSRRNL